MIRESERLEATSDRTEKSDHAINAATDGWHLVDWVWDAMMEIERMDPMIAESLDPHTQHQLRLQHKEKQRAIARLRVEIGKEFGVGPASVGKSLFGRYMAKHHRAIEICRIIATGSKHVGVDHISDVEVETYVSAPASTATTLEVGDVFTSVPVEVVNTGVPKIRYGGMVFGSSDVFREAAQIWTGFIYSNKIDH